MYSGFLNVTLNPKRVKHAVTNKEPKVSIWMRALDSERYALIDQDVKDTEGDTSYEHLSMKTSYETQGQISGKYNR